MHFDLVDLKLMVCVADFNSLTKGAEGCFLSLPAASTRIKNLEASVGAKLLYRTSHGVTLTSPGQAFVQRARSVLAQIEGLRGDMQEYGRGIKGHLRVWANTTSLSEFLPPVFTDYLRRNPDVNIDLRERLSSDIVRAVSEGQVDIGIVAGDVRTEALETIPYRTDRLMLVVPENHPLAGVGRAPFSESLKFDHVVLSESTALHAFLRRICGDGHLLLKQRIQVSNFETACRFIEQGVGVGIVPESAAKRHSQSMALRLISLEDAWAVRQMKIVTKELEMLPGFARELIALLVADARCEVSRDAPEATLDAKLAVAG